MKSVVYTNTQIHIHLRTACTWFLIIIIIIIIIIIVVGIQPLGWSGQRPEFSQANGMALVKFLGVACHCFPPLF